MSTHVARKSKWRRVMACLPGLGFLALFFFLALMNPTNIAQTRLDHSDAAMRTRVYRAPLAHVAAVVKLAIPTLKTYGRAWQLKQARADGDHYILRAQVPVIVFSDDLEVTIREDKPRHVRLDVRSASRVGRSDLGENRRHVIQLLRAVDKQLARQDTP